MLYRAMVGLFNRVWVKQVHFNDTNYLYILVSNVFNFILYYIATFYLTYMIFCYQRGSIVSWWSISRLKSNNYNSCHTSNLYRSCMNQIIDTLFSFLFLLMCGDIHFQSGANQQYQYFVFILIRGRLLINSTPQYQKYKKQIRIYL